MDAYDKYPVLNNDNLTWPIQLQLSQKQNAFSQFLAQFLKSRLNFKYFEKKGDPHGFIISEIMASENVVRQMSKKSGFRGTFDKQDGKRIKALLKSAPGQLSWKKSRLLICKILALLVNTLAADWKYPVLNRDNLMIPIQMQLSQKRKIFSEFVV